VRKQDLIQFVLQTRKMGTFTVQSPNVLYTKDFIESKYNYETTKVVPKKCGYEVLPVETEYTFRTERQVPKVGCMLVGWGGNNGCTITAAVLANKMGLSWETKHGVKVRFNSMWGMAFHVRCQETVDEDIDSSAEYMHAVRYGF